MSSLEIEGLELAYGQVVALRDVSIKVAEGAAVSILGANGAGKTSLLKSITGLAQCRRGTITWRGEDITNRPAYEAVDRGIVLCPEGRRLFPEMSVAENLRMGAFRNRSSREIHEDLQRVYTLFPRLAERKLQPAASLSGGEQQMCAIGRALMARPRLILMDEPSLGLAPKVIVEVARIIRTIRANGITVLLVEQNAKLALRLTEYAYILERGRITMAAPSCDLLEDPYVRSAYLGEQPVEGRPS